jgi:4-hydroxybenzoate polyprenyltransferase
MMKKIDRSKKFLLLIRPFHIVHQISLITLALSVRNLLFETAAIDIILVWLMQFLVMPLTLLLNDYFHRSEDRSMNLNHRLFAGKEIDRSIIVIISIVLLVIIGSIALSRSLTSLFAMVVIFTSASLYGYFKHKRMTFTTYIFRAVSGGSLYLFIASYFNLILFDFYIAILIFFMDLTAHITGDLRDLEKDILVPIKTFPVVFSERKTELIVLLLQIFTLFYLILVFYFRNQLIDIYTIFFIVLVVASGFTIYYLLRTKHFIFTSINFDRYRQWYHACFHGPKIITIFILSIRLSIDVSIFEYLIIILISSFVWIISYSIYLSVDNRILSSYRWDQIISRSIKNRALFADRLSDDIKFNYLTLRLKNDTTIDQSIITSLKNTRSKIKSKIEQDQSINSTQIDLLNESLLALESSIHQ